MLMWLNESAATINAIFNILDIMRERERERERERVWI